MPAPHTNTETPVMRQYLEIKAAHPDAILLFRMGDFYELFFEDAVTVAPILDIAVTTRDRNVEHPVPMAGVPWHSVGGYVRTLVERGFRVAICDQLESPEEAKRRRGPDKIVRRGVVRVLSPGTLIDDEHLEGGVPNYLAAVVLDTRSSSTGCVAAIDITQGELTVTAIEGDDGLGAELARLGARELLVEAAHEARIRTLVGREGPVVRTLATDGAARDRAKASERVLALWRDAGLGGRPSALEHAAAIGVLLEAEASQPGQTLLLHRIRRHSTERHLVLDETSLRNLEIFRTIRDGQRKGSLLWAIDRTVTAPGARTLRSWLAAPLADRAAIEARHDAIAALVTATEARARLKGALSDVRDVVRLAARTRLRVVSPRDLGALRDSLAALPRVHAALSAVRGPVEAVKAASPRALTADDPDPAHALALGDDLLAEVHEALARVLVDQPPVHAREGGVIRPGADARLDEQRALARGGQDALAAIEARERDATGIERLRVQHNRVFGYFLELPRTQVSRVPNHWVRKQTTATTERYLTEELSTLEARVLGAQTEALAREHALLEALVVVVSGAAERLARVGEALGRIDALCGLAEVAAEGQWVRPQWIDAPVVDIEQGRHPVVERMLDRGQFVPNDLCVDATAVDGRPRLLLITGPNMGGKSTVMRQAALLAVLAHVGSFVPARALRLGVIDRIFTRVGAADDLGRGESTFMVEMRETAQILAHASARSLVLLDEIGRGTATFDGLSLSWAITEHLHDQIACRTLFATHYHELCALADRLPGLSNAHVAVHEEAGDVVFLHSLRAGPAGRSYGIFVGRLAGLPERVLRRATKLLARLERSDAGHDTSQLQLFSLDRAPTDATSATSAPTDGAAQPVGGGERADRPGQGQTTSAVGAAVGPAQGLAVRLAERLGALLDVDLDDLTPRAAHDRLRAVQAAVRDALNDAGEGR